MAEVIGPWTAFDNIARFFGNMDPRGNGKSTSSGLGFDPGYGNKVPSSAKEHVAKLVKMPEKVDGNFVVQRSGEAEDASCEAWAYQRAAQATIQMIDAKLQTYETAAEVAMHGYKAAQKAASVDRRFGVAGLKHAVVMGSEEARMQSAKSVLSLNGKYQSMLG